MQLFYTKKEWKQPGKGKNKEEEPPQVDRRKQ
jgi:hypothetical protein